MILTIKVSGLSHERENQSDPNIAWEMSHNSYHMYSDIKNKEGGYGFATN